MHHDDIGAGLLDLAQHVGGDDHRATPFDVLVQHIAHRPDLGRVEAVRRLVEDEEIGLAEHGLRDAEALTHALAVGADLAVDCCAEVGDFEHFVEVGLLAAAASSAPVEVEVLPP